MLNLLPLIVKLRAAKEAFAGTESALTHQEKVALLEELIHELEAIETGEAE